jgi:glutathione synthase/RimK-type ligase-like ATP-grasp enzyme
MTRPNIAIATSLPAADQPPGEQLLIAALAQAGASATQAIWSSSEVDWAQFSAVVIRTCWDYHLRVPEFMAWIQSLDEQNIAVINHPELICWNVDKSYLQQLATSGIAIPETIWLQPEEEADIAKLCATHEWEQAVIKPIISASAYGTERRNFGQVQGPMMIQQYLPAIKTEGEWSLIYFDHEFSHAVRKRPRPADFRVQKDFGGSIEPATPPSTLTTFAEAALHLLPHPATFARVDLVEQDGRICLMETEVIEPELFLNYAPESAQRLANSILRELSPPPRH